MAIDPVDLQICTSADAQPAMDGTPVSQAIVQTSLFSFPTFNDLLDGLSDEYRHCVYTRGRNPTLLALEHKLAALERGEACKVFSSGMSAVSSTIFGIVQQGDHVLFVNQVYGPTLQLADHLTRFGVTHSRVINGDIDAIEQAITPKTKLIWIESPATMTFELVDLAAVTALAKASDITTVLDNSWATPLFQKPLLHGVDLVVHSCTKYLGGHSDVVAGAVIGSDAMIEQLFYRAFLLNGGALGPFDGWLTSRSLRTLPLRMQQHESSALQIAEFLHNHSRVRCVYHPALSGDQELLGKQLTGTSGLFSFELKDAGYSQIAACLDAMSVFRLGISWGGFESLAVSPCRRGNEEQLAAAGIPGGLIRLSVGLEDPDHLIADLDQALTE